tara:strand:+ start:81 stop:665 length:585 start_codon:yes stop_codon:yes gene_type:complete
MRLFRKAYWQRSLPVAIILFFFGYLYSTPYLAIISFKSAIDSSNSEEASRYIDFISVRSSIKKQINGYLRDDIVSVGLSNQFGDIGRVFLEPLTEKLVNITLDYTVTPRGLSLLLNTGKLSRNNHIHTYKPDESKNSNHKPEINLYYKGLNHFVLTSSIQNSNQEIKAYWNRDRIIYWKLKSIELPADTLKSFR